MYPEYYPVRAYGFLLMRTERSESHFRSPETRKARKSVFISLILHLVACVTYGWKSEDAISVEMNGVGETSKK